MKGRRKVISGRWSLQAQVEVEARRTIENRSKKVAHRFLDTALVFGRDFEPTGRLAGNLRGSPAEKNRNTLPTPQIAVGHLRKANLATLLIQTVEVVIRAGQLLITEWARVDGPRGKDDKAVVDVEIELLLRQQLLNLLPCDFWGEETGHRLTGHSWCWVVDPNDGTGDFLKGIKGSALSVGLLHEQTPVLGVVFAPITVEGVPDCIAWAEGLPHILRNGEPVTAKLDTKVLVSGTYVMVSSAATSQPEMNSLLCKPATFIAMPSIAYRLAKVAAGDGVCGISLHPVSAHDVAAGHALLRGAGGALFNERGEAITYVSQDNMQTVSQRCFGGSVLACRTLIDREWHRIFIEA